MSRAYSFAVLIGGLVILSSVEVDAQSTVDDSESCESSTFNEAVKIIREDLKDVKLIREDLRSLLGSNRRQSSAVDLSSLDNCVPLLIQQNRDGSDFFNRSWAEFKAGFNDSRGNYWLGNDLLHQLTDGSRDKFYKLRFDLQVNRNLSWYYAEYGRFVVSSEADGYKILVTDYSGNAGDAFWYHDGMRFTTYDRDNELRDDINCAAVNGGGFWYTGNNACGSSNVNADRTGREGFKWYSRDNGGFYFQSTRMWLTC